MPYIPQDRRDLLEEPLLRFIELHKGSSNARLCDCVLVILSSFNEDAGSSLGFHWEDTDFDLRDSLTDLPDGPNVGDLNYTITRFLEGAVIEDEVRYSKLNRCVGVLSTLRVLSAPLLSGARCEELANNLIDCLGVLRCCEHEFLRRLHDPYEDKCIEKNGDCFEHYRIELAVRGDGTWGKIQLLR